MVILYLFNLRFRFDSNSLPTKQSAMFLTTACGPYLLQFIAFYHDSRINDFHLRPAGVRFRPAAASISHVYIIV